MSARGSQQDLASLARKASDVKEYFRQGLGLEPTDESKAYVSYLVQRSRWGKVQMTAAVVLWCCMA
jgi:hypothetical protein